MKLPEGNLSFTPVIKRMTVNCFWVFQESMFMFSSKEAFYNKNVLFGWYKGLMNNWKMITPIRDQNTLIRFYQGFMIIFEDIITYGCRMMCYSGGSLY